jgi:hypothetical protein
LALNSGAWFFLFVILDRLSLQAIHVNNSSEIPRPPLQVWRPNLWRPPRLARCARGRACVLTSPGRPPDAAECAAGAAQAAWKAEG